MALSEHSHCKTANRMLSLLLYEVEFVNFLKLKAFFGLFWCVGIREIVMRIKWRLPCDGHEWDHKKWNSASHSKLNRLFVLIIRICMEVMFKIIMDSLLSGLHNVQRLLFPMLITLIDLSGVASYSSSYT